MSGSEFTSLADVIVPEIFEPYVVEQATQTNAFFKSGIVATVPDLTLGDKGGQLVNMPFWKPFGERAQLLDDTTDLEVRKVGSGNDIAVLNTRALVYGATDLATALAGSDPLANVIAKVADNWSLEMNAMILAVLQGAIGAMGAESPAVNVYDISALSGTASQIDGHSFVDAAQALGDAKSKIAGIAMHSATESALAKKDLITTVRDSEGKWLFNQFQGKQVIVDDAMAPASGDVYTTYLFGQGAIGYGEGTPKVASETKRDPLINGGQEYLVSRRHFILHPRGIKWAPASGVPAKQTPDDSELADPTNWVRVYEPKNIRIVQFLHKV